MNERECKTHAEVDATIAVGDMVVLRGSAHAALYGTASAVEGDTGRALRQSRPVVLLGPLGSRNAMLSIDRIQPRR